ncbi:Elongator subunit IKI3 Ecym_3279 [Eremothecium cymbalariae DBVPG|uniref:Elongator complex protein 1 n=1 Tax=Eremothecium cymbalariae (strain CBS 270.75 / DBVPG 7215 / KCTC 17166 / NRRL Y-17582) TaxID=931890 RepID=G8JRK3_ERECY|nr:Hypothetical protein Ecym_3279 [Eremothecium cymbalariae DBVPG\
MRNLIILNRGKLTPTSHSHPDLQLLTSSFDILSDSITCVLHALDNGVIEVQQYRKDGTVNDLASFFVQSYNDKLLSFIHFADINQLIFVFAQGDIICATYDPTSLNPEETVVEVVGSIDNGIMAAEWSYDEETLAILTMDRSVVLLSRQFEPIAETKLEADDLKISKHVTVGWGTKETQFRGKGARAMEREALESLKNSGLVGNELRDPTMPFKVDSGAITEMDNKSGAISWRSDCEYFVVSTVEVVKDAEDESKDLERRALRVYSRDGQLDSASEPVDGLEHNLAWKPQGSLIAGIQRKIDTPNEESLDLVFFERNGLRHGEFNTRLAIDERINSLAWNASSEVLAVVLENRIQLWTTKNYHWYLKQELYGNNIRFFKWNPEKDFTLMYGDLNDIYVVDLTYKMALGPTIKPFDRGTALVIDGKTVNITPFTIANVPPPVYFRDFEAPGNVIDVATSRSNELYAALVESALVLASVPSIDAMVRGKHPVIVTTIPKHQFATELDIVRQVAFINDNFIGVLLDSDNISRIALISIADITQPSLLTIVDTYTKVVLLRSSFEYNSLVYETRDCKIVQLDANGITAQIAQFPQLACDFRVKRISLSDTAHEWHEDQSKCIAIGLTSGGKLFANTVQLSSAVLSLEITDSLLLITTAQHYLQFVHLNTTEFQPLPPIEGDVFDERVRAIERGSLLVGVSPSKSAVVLQAPRGNLETIYPRIMVLAVVRKNISDGAYKEAFETCRTHRINLDILHDYAPEMFFGNLEGFINQIENVDYLNLFISCLSDEDVTETKYKETLDSNIAASLQVAPPQLTEMELYIKKKTFDSTNSKVNKICKAMLKVLLGNATYKEKYLQTILTSYACQNPPNLEDALTLIGELLNVEERDSAITYLCFLQDVNLVYKIALSLYDVELSLAVAQKSQMDPREYLPFLQKLHSNETGRRKFIIDDYLSNYEKALGHLAELEQSKDKVSEELIEYVQTHQLHKEALNIFRYETMKQNYIYYIYAQHLTSKQEYNEAGIVYEMLCKWSDAVAVYTLGNKWAEALSIVTTHFPKKIPEISEKLVNSLTLEHKYAAAAQIELKFLNNIPASVELYCKASAYDEAILLCSEKGQINLVTEVVDPALGEGFSTVAELIADCKSQVNSQLKRLRELRTKKEADPYAFYGQETEQADDVSIAPSETSTKESFFTRYTGKTGGTAKTGASRRTAKNKRREERKRARGKKGTIYEEEYLVQSIGRLIERLEQTQPDAVKLIDGLLRRNMREQAHQIQKGFMGLLAFLKDNVVEIYTISEKDRERIDEDGAVYYLPEIPIPELKGFPKRNIIDY